MTVGERLEQVIEMIFGQNGRAAFGRAIGTDPNSVGKWVRNRSKPSGDTLIRISELGVNIHWLLTGSGTTYADNEAGEALRRKHEAHTGGVDMEASHDKETMSSSSEEFRNHAPNIASARALLSQDNSRVSHVFHTNDSARA